LPLQAACGGHGKLCSLLCSSIWKEFGFLGPQSLFAAPFQLGKKIINADILYSENDKKR
jgi:hypothetical protein